MRAMREFTVSATKRLPSGPSAPPVGPIISAFGSVLTEIPLAITVLATRCGRPPPNVSVSRTTSPFVVADGEPLVMPVSTFVTNRSAAEPKSSAVASHGPLMPCPVMTFRT
jgi:hypothetical protein